MINYSLLQNYAILLKSKYLERLAEKELYFFDELNIPDYLLLETPDKKRVLFFEELLNSFEKNQNIAYTYKKFFNQKLDHLLSLNIKINIDDFILYTSVHKMALLSFLTEYSTDNNIIISTTNIMEIEYIKAQKAFIEFSSNFIHLNNQNYDSEKNVFDEHFNKEIELEKHRFNDLANSIPGIVWEIVGLPFDLTQKINYISNLAEQITGFDLDIWLNTPGFWLEIIHPDDRPAIINELKKRFTYNGLMDSLKYRWVNKSGKVLWIENYHSHIYNQNGEIIGMRGVIFDISSRKESQEKLVESEEKLSLIFDSTSDLMLLVSVESDGDFIPISANKAYIDVLTAYNPNFSKEKFYGLSLSDVTREVFGLEQDMIDFVYTKYNQAIEAGVPISYDENIGTQYFAEITLTPIFDQYGDCTHLLYVSRDITARKQAEIEIEKQKQELKRSNEALEQFASIASHDLQEPVRMVKQYLKLLEKRYKDKLDSDAHEFIYYALDGAARMESLIKHLLDYAKIDKPNQHLTITDFNIVVEQSLLNLKNLIKENEAEVSVDPLPLLKASPIQISQLFQNLISNAIKYRRDEKPVIKISCEKKENQIIFSVADNGIGIEDRHFEKIFHLFKRLHAQDEYSGVGIGLAVCKKIVEQYEGKIWVNSQPGKGSTFFFSLPES